MMWVRFVSEMSQAQLRVYVVDEMANADEVIQVSDSGVPVYKVDDMAHADRRVYFYSGGGAGDGSSSGGYYYSPPKNTFKQELVGTGLFFVWVLIRCAVWALGLLCLLFVGLAFGSTMSHKHALIVPYLLVAAAFGVAAWVLHKKSEDFEHKHL
jgi:hypothetical protein